MTQKEIEQRNAYARANGLPTIAELEKKLGTTYTMPTDNLFIKLQRKLKEQRK